MRRGAQRRGRGLFVSVCGETSACIQLLLLVAVLEMPHLARALCHTVFSLCGDLMTLSFCSPLLCLAVIWVPLILISVCDLCDDVGRDWVLWRSNAYLD